MNYLMLFHATVSNYTSFLQCVLWTTGCGDGEMDGLEPSRPGLSYIKTKYTWRGWSKILPLVNYGKIKPGGNTKNKRVNGVYTKHNQGVGLTK